MKIKELNLADYPHKRVCVIDTHGPKYYPPCSDEVVLRTDGDREIAENGIQTDENGDWLTITPVKETVENNGAADKNKENA